MFQIRDDFAESDPQVESGISGQLFRDEQNVYRKRALAVMPFLSHDLAIQRGLVPGHDITNKFGRNPDVDTAAVEDVWAGGGVYTGFPVGAPEEFQVFSSSASDLGTVSFFYLANNTSTSWQQATVQLNGTTPVNTGITGHRMHTANYSSGDATTFNLGTITIRHRTTTTNVFCQMPIGRSQTNVSAYTVPFGHTGYIAKLFCRVIGATTGTVDGALWVRTLNGSPRLRRPFSSAQQDHFEEMPLGGLIIPAGADIIIRVTGASTNNLDVIAGYDIIIMKDA